MDVVVLSGKGGTGKTTIATNLSKILGYAYVDCDVEEPNGYIFLKPKISEEKEVKLWNPTMNNNCLLCGRCVTACEYNALVKVLDKIMIFEELCHGCGACQLACDNEAIEGFDRTIGILKKNHEFAMGQLNLREPMGGPIISVLKKETNHFEHRILDAPPGTSCSVVKAVQGSDYAILVTEPTAFGLHDLKLAIQLIQDMKIPFGVIINRYESHTLIDDYLNDMNIPCIGRVPFSREAAVQYSKGDLLIESEKYHQVFEAIGHQVRRLL